MTHAEIAANARRPYALAIQQIEAQRRQLVEASQTAFQTLGHMRRNPTQPPDMDRVMIAMTELYSALKAQEMR